MKYIVILILLFLNCCSNSKFCNTRTRIISNKNIDTTGPFKIKGAYCIQKVNDTLINNFSILSANFYSIINGQILPDGVIWIFGNDTSSFNSNNNKNQKLIKPGKYKIAGTHIGFLETKTKMITIKPNTKIQINFYLGTVTEQ